MATTEQMEKMHESFQRKVSSFGITTPNVFESVKGIPRIKLLDAPAVDFFEMCDRTFGDNWIWSTTMWNEETTIFFKDPCDATIFRLLTTYKTA